MRFRLVKILIILGLLLMSVNAVSAFDIDVPDIFSRALLIWNYNNFTGNISDDSDGYAWHGNISKDVSIGVDPKYGNFINLTGTGAHVAALGNGSSGFFHHGATGITTCMVHQFDAVGIPYNQMGATGQWRMILEGSTAFRSWWSKTGAPVEDATGTPAVLNNSWTWSCMSINTSGATKMIQTTQNTHNAGTGLFTQPLKTFRVGSIYNGANSMDGAIAFTIVIDSTLSKEEMQGLYEYVYLNGSTITNGTDPEDPAVAPPIISGVISTSPDPDDPTEPYNTGGDVTPTFNATTDKASTCGISLVNNSFVDFGTTGGTAHIVTAPNVAFGTDNLFVNCTSGFGVVAWDEWAISTPFIAGNVTNTNNISIVGVPVIACLSNLTNGTVGCELGISNTTGEWDFGVQAGVYNVCAFGDASINLSGYGAPNITVAQP